MGLTPKQEKYCNNRAKGMSQRQAYRDAYDAENCADNTVDSKACVLEASGKVSERLEQLKMVAQTEAVASLEEILAAQTLKLRKGVEATSKRVTVAGNAAIDGSTDRLMMWTPKAADADARRSPDYAMVLAPSFLRAHRMIANGDAVDFWLGGGRGSMKSSCASLEVVKWVEEHPDQHGIVFMKHKVNLRDGAYAQVVWAINALGLADKYDMPDSTLRITRKETGQLILFRGVDNAKKIKSITVPHGHIGIAWYEEADMFRGMGEIREVNQSITRGGSGAVRIYTFNPPRSNRSWVNEHVQQFLADDAVYFKSTYLDAPKEWLGEQFVTDAEHLRETDENAYRHEYLGEPVGSGTEVFDRVEFREITDDEIASFDNPKLGQDFGWYPDPWAFTVSEWQQGGRTLLTYYEDGGNKLQPNQQAERILKALDELNLPGEPVYSDDAAPQDIQAQRDMGVNARKADKGGMRAASYKFIQSAKWVIDPQRCPRLAAEVRAMEYEVSRDGEVLNTIPDGNDHWVDATRYALMRNARQGRTAYRDE